MAGILHMHILTRMNASISRAPRFSTIYIRSYAVRFDFFSSIYSLCPEWVCAKTTTSSRSGLKYVRTESHTAFMIVLVYHLQNFIVGCRRRCRRHRHYSAVDVSASQKAVPNARRKAEKLFVYMYYGRHYYFRLKRGTCIPHYPRTGKIK